MASVVIAAHNEEAVIGKCLDALLAGAAPGELDITVAANGCTDRTTSEAAARSGVRVVDIGEASKSKALNAGDRAASGFPRMYLDADIVASAEVIRALTRVLGGVDDAMGGTSSVLAAVPRRIVDLAGRPLIVRAYYAISSRLPAFREGLFGRGLIALSASGRARFELFPEVIADDLFLDSLFTVDEKCEVSEVSTTVAAPFRTRDLIRRLVRVRRGNAALRAAAKDGLVMVDVRSADRFAWWREVVRPEPRLVPAAVVYVAITAYAGMLAKLERGVHRGWGRDDSTREGTDARL